MSFSQQIASFGDKASAQVQKVRRGVVIKLFSAVILDSPVLTGRFRGNWQAKIGAPIVTITERLDKSGQEPIREVETAAKESDGDQAVFLSNNLPYGPKLEFDGWSKKAPEGMVRRNVARFGRLITVEVNNRK